MKKDSQDVINKKKKIIVLIILISFVILVLIGFIIGLFVYNVMKKTDTKNGNIDTSYVEEELTRRE